MQGPTTSRPLRSDAFSVVSQFDVARPRAHGARVPPGVHSPGSREPLSGDRGSLSSRANHSSKTEDHVPDQSEQRSRPYPESGESVQPSNGWAYVGIALALVCGLTSIPYYVAHWCVELYR